MTHLDRVAVWKRLDGGVSITYFDTRDMLDGESEDDFIQRQMNKIKDSEQLVGSTVTLINKSDVPSDRTHRDCWDIKQNKVEVDAVKLSEKLSKIDEKSTAKLEVLSKLKITPEELKNLIG